MIMATVILIIGTTNIGLMIIGTTAIGYITHTGTTVSTTCGGTHGGGIGTGYGAIGVTTSIGISFMLDSMLSGIKMVAGGLDHGMVTGSRIGYLTHTTQSTTMPA
jgi:hypothetical protein